MTELIDRGLWLEMPRRATPPAAQRTQGALPAMPSAAATPSTPSAAAFGIGGVGTRGRVTTDRAGSLLDGLIETSLTAPISSELHWRGWELDAETLSRVSPARLLELLSDLSPEVSVALWHFLRFGNPGHEAKASRPGGAMAGKGRHQQALDAFLGTLTARHGAIDVILGRLLLGAFLRGAFFVELVLDDAGRVPLDIATPDPASVEFRKIKDPDVGERWQIGQRIAGDFVPLERATIRYVPIDPLPADPYGRAPASPSLFSAVFLLAMMHDLRRVVQQQGYPRIDIAIDLAKLRETMPAELESDPNAVASWISGAITSIQRVYANLKPDDAYVHPDITTVNRPVGTLDASSLGAVDGLIKAIERMLVRALKTAPILLGMTDGVSEANVRVQWKVYKATLRTFQHTLEQLMSYLLRLAMEAQGIPCEVAFKFAAADITDRLIDAQTEEIEIRNSRSMYEAGWITQDEAAQRHGLEKAAEAEPIAGTGTKPPTPQPQIVEQPKPAADEPADEGQGAQA